jgi:hypothetical protein
VTKFRTILETDPDDLTVMLLYEKDVKYQCEDVPEIWTGVEEMIGK